MEAQRYFTYMVRCSDDSLYTGFTVDLQARIATHNEGKGAKYTRSRRPVKLVYWEEFSTEHEARSRECALKKLSREQKIQLIGGSYGTS